MMKEGTAVHTQTDLETLVEEHEFEKLA